MDLRGFLAAVAVELGAGVSPGPDRALSDRFGAAVAAGSPQSVESSRVPCVDAMAPLGSPLFDELLALSPGLPWTPTTRVDDGGTGCAVLDFGSCFDLGPIRAGAIAIAPHHVYPEHDHPPRELYLVLSGPSEWRWGGHAGLRTVEAGDVLVNPPSVRHRVVAGAVPVLAVWVLEP